MQQPKNTTPCRFGAVGMRTGGSKFNHCKCAQCRDLRNSRWLARLNESPGARDERRKRYSDRHATDPLSKMLQAAKSRAKKFNVPFSLCREDVSIPTHCPALGIPLQVGKGKITDGSPSLDRVRPELGYVRGNVVVVSHLANRIKNSATLEQMISVAGWALRMLKETAN